MGGKMKRILVLLTCCFLLFSCSGSGGGGGDKEGTATFSITDSKPMLPEGVTNVFVTIDEISIHSNGNWQVLPMTTTPFIIDLLEYTNGETTQIVPPIILQPATYTQLRMSVKEASLRVLNPDQTTEDFPIDVPSGSLKTDTPFTVDLLNRGYIDMVIDFDLSQSIVVTGNGKYKLKPVLHIVKVNDAVIFEGLILNTLFVEGINPVVTVYDKDGVIYSQVVVELEPAPEIDSQWQVFWIVPDQNYKVEIDYNGDKVADFTKDVLAETIPPGTTLQIE
jgi:hypothetical protein